MLLPFKTQLSKMRIRGEGSVFKNVTTIARLSRLKPLRNPNVFLDLHILDKILIEFKNLLQSPPIALDVVIPVHLPNESSQAGSILRDFNPLVNIRPGVCCGGDAGQSSHYNRYLSRSSFALAAG